MVDTKDRFSKIDGVGDKTRARASQDAERVRLRNEDAQISNVLSVTHVGHAFLSKHHEHRVSLQSVVSVAFDQETLSRGRLDPVISPGTRIQKLVLGL